MASMTLGHFTDESSGRHPWPPTNSPNNQTATRGGGGYAQTKTALKRMLTARQGIFMMVVAWGVSGCSWFRLPEKPDQAGMIGEPAPSFRVEQILPRQIIRGRNYVIQSPVTVVGYNYLFNIETPYGTIPAHGKDALEMRLREMGAIEEADRLNRQAHIAAGAIGSLRNTTEGLGELLSNPGGALLRAPTGFKRMVDQALDASDRRAGSDFRRQLAHRLGCDPETTNPVLKKLLDEMSIKYQLGGLMGGSAMSLALPGMGLLSTTAEIKQMVASTPPHKINEYVEGELIRLRIAPEAARKFVRNMNYTTMQRLIMFSLLRQLPGVARLQVLIEAANDVQNESQGLSVIHAAYLLVELNKLRPIRQLVDVGMTAAILHNEVVVLVGAVDYLRDTREIRNAIAQYRRDYPNAQTLFLTSGAVSPAARQVFSDAVIQVLDNGQIIP